MKFFTFVGIFILIGAKSCHGENEDAGDRYLYNEVDFHESVESKAHFIMFYAPWCGHCKSLKPAWSELSDYYNSENPDIITIARVDCTTDTKLCSDHGVTGYPTLKIYQPGKEGVRYNGGRDLPSLKLFVSATLGLEGVETQEEVDEVEVDEGLYELTDNTFDSHITTGMHFVKFFAPWCGHCQRMEPAWKELAAKHKDDDGVKIARVDCTKQKKVCGAKGVRGYPTLILFKDGQEVEKYEGGRNLDNFVSYIEKMRDGATQQPLSEEEEREVVQEDKAQPDAEVEEGLYELTADNFAKLTTDGDFFIKFFAPWCGHCRNMEPAWKELAKLYENHEQVRIARVDCTQHSTVCQSKGVRGYPTLKYFRNGQELEGTPRGRNFNNLKEFVAGKLEQAEEVEQEEQKEEGQVQEEQKDEVEPSGALELDDSIFHDVVNTGFTFVKFYAPWCGHCKRLAPVWDQLANEDFSSLGRTVRIVKIDCTKFQSICAENGVRGYPTLKLFIDGVEKEKYSGARSLDDLKSYVIAKATESIEEKIEFRDEL